MRKTVSVDKLHPVWTLGCHYDDLTGQLEPQNDYFMLKFFNYPFLNISFAAVAELLACKLQKKA